MYMLPGHLNAETLNAGTNVIIMMQKHFVLKIPNSEVTYNNADTDDTMSSKIRKKHGEIHLAS